MKSGFFGMTVMAPQAEAQTHDAETLKEANKFKKLLSLTSAKSHVHNIFKLLS